MVAVVRDGRAIIGVGTIKRKRPKYAAKIAERSGFAFDQDMHELGYIAVADSHRGKGLSHQIVEKLLSAFGSGAIFATTSCVIMNKTFKAAGFELRGEEWRGRSGKVLSLWIREVDFPTGSA
jgi:predicted GNAT family acetyltransferase